MSTGLWAPAMGEERALLEFSIGDDAIPTNPLLTIGIVILFIP